jgi:hypothetical protein
MSCCESTIVTIPRGDSMDLIDNVLISILAATDAIFIPDRDPCHPVKHVALYERRRDFPMRGVPWGSDRVLPGLGAAGRKQVQRVVEQAIGKGLVHAFKPRAKTLGVRLTDEGDARARAIAGLPGYADALAMLDQIRALVTALGGGRRWIPETWLAGLDWGDDSRRRAFVAVEEYLLPALHRGLVVSNGSIRGHTWYDLTPAGLALTKRRASKPAPAPADKFPESEIEARGEYYERVHQELASLCSAQVENEREIGEIPLSLGIGLPCHVSDRPASVAPPLVNADAYLRPSA